MKMNLMLVLEMNSYDWLILMVGEVQIKLKHPIANLNFVDNQFKTRKLVACEMK